MASWLRTPCDAASAHSAAESEGCTPSARPWVLAATVLGSSLAFIDGSAVGVALPALQREFAAPIGQVQWVMNGYVLFLASLTLIGGAAGDRYGRRRLFMAGLVLFAAASIACALAPTPEWLIAARCVKGIGGAMLTPSSLAILSAAYPKESRGQAIGVWAGFATLTAAGGPVLGGWLVDALGWRAIFWVNPPLAVLALLITLRFVPESRSGESGPLDWPGAALAALGLGLVTLGLVNASGAPLAAPPVWGPAAAGLGLLAAFVGWELRARHPMAPPGLFKVPAFLGANLLTLFLYFALTGVLFFLPFDLIQVQGYSAARAGAALLPFSLPMGLLSPFAGRMMKVTGARLPMIVGPLVTGAAIAWLGLLGRPQSYWTGFFPPALLLGLGMTICVAPLTATVFNAVGEKQSGIASGVNNAVARLAGLLAVALLGAVASASYGQALERRLAAETLPAAVAEHLRGHKADLAATPPPPGADPALAGRADRLVDDAFLEAFRLVALICAAAAAGSAGFTLALVRDAKPRQGRDADDGTSP